MAWSLPVRADRSENQGAVEIERGLRAHMLDPAPAIRAQAIEAQGIPIGIDQADQTGAKRCEPVVRGQGPFARYARAGNL